MFQDLTNIIIPIAVCVVLPISVVWIVMRTAQLRDRQRAEIIMKAIETNNDVDVDRLMESLENKPRKTPRTPLQQLNLRLTVGSVFTMIGALLGGLSIYFVSNEPMFLFFILGICTICLGVGVGFLISYFSMSKHMNAGK